ILADGRLLWRVVDNLLNNVLKYTLSGTRVYIDAFSQGKFAFITIKNVSRDALNISSDELMERFVRGDSSRNTEGSGLGLNIARSLTDLQGGRLSLHIDGDLFKAELSFPLLLQ
ncbi:MAG: GHKL domain-containing protein, partial [Firmicutes bacterium]|nr:GHKL domain-containing protein [Bacillota bacterium]